jgi:uncharacterized protein
LIRLRGHHLICLHFFSGEGFQTEFIENLREIIKNAEAGEEVCACSGPDDICNRCPYLKAELCLYKKEADEEIRKMDQAAQELLHINTREEINWLDLTEKITGIFSAWSGQYCIGCDWKRVCEKNREFSRLMRARSRR